MDMIQSLSDLRKYLLVGVAFVIQYMMVGAGLNAQNWAASDITQELLPASDEDQPMRPLLALKTNLLFDALTVLNVEVEVPLKKRWSVAAEGMFQW